MVLLPAFKRQEMSCRALVSLARAKRDSASIHSRSKYRILIFASAGRERRGKTVTKKTIISDLLRRPAVLCSLKMVAGINSKTVLCFLVC
ncbi:hypothetical protein HOLleu_13912 [Holothuria leucospilota]|uniref:Uncharacterized protein n=1 Tax=Holothuria leucospilota TaxID=206669 RepID=A0A9Q1C852_HOLLE|nr:hypothetical protein HOLleu_13912 [Holothuria leucospilota]